MRHEEGTKLQKPPNRKSLSEKLLDLVTPSPTIGEVDEDAVNAESRARIIEKTGDVSFDEDRKQSRLRIANQESLDAVSWRYHGKKISRKKLEKDGMSSEVDPGEKQKLLEHLQDCLKEDLDLESEESSISTKESLEEAPSDDLSEEEAGEETEMAEEEEDEEESSVGEEDESEQGGEESSDDEVMEGITSTLNEENEIRRGVAVRQQLALWDKFLELRIKLQKLLGLANQLPQPESFPAFINSGDTDSEKALKRNRRLVYESICHLLHAQSILLCKDPATKSLITGQSTRNEDSDEEIPSDEASGTEEPQEDLMDEDLTQLKPHMDKKEVIKGLLKQQDKTANFVEDTLTKWDSRTKVASGKSAGMQSKRSFAAFETQPICKQIEHLLQDRDRLIRRTQLKRSQYQVLGKRKAPEIEEAPVDEYDEQIFNDDDFYHQLLRELIERKTVDTSDPTTMGRQWLEIQKLRSRLKKKRDNRASKERKLSFEVHQKLLNFTAPIPQPLMSHEAINELFRSLFGKNQNQEFKGQDLDILLQQPT